MSKRSAAEPHPFQALEEQAYFAFREWPIWLVLRERELAAHLQSNHGVGKPPLRPTTAENAGQQPGKQRSHPTLDKRGT